MPATKDLAGCTFERSFAPGQAASLRMTWGGRSDGVSRDDVGGRAASLRMTWLQR